MPSFSLFHKQKKQEKSTTAPKEEAAEQLAENTQPKTGQTETTTSSAVKNVSVEGNMSEEKAVVGVSESGVAVVGDGGVGSLGSDVVSASFGAGKMYLKAMPLRDSSDLEGIKVEVQRGNILILRITPLASKSIDAVKSAVNELYLFTEAIGGDIARLGEERVVICPKSIRIWREKAPTKNEALSTTTAASIAVSKVA
jgi:SepF-like predicted cell division protein (DUF552 family)